MAQISHPSLVNRVCEFHKKNVKPTTAQLFDTRGDHKYIVTKLPLKFEVIDRVMPPPTPTKKKILKRKEKEKKLNPATEN